MIDLMLGVVAPHICSECGSIGAVLCDSCYNDIESEDFGRCAWCFAPASSAHQCATCALRINSDGTWVVGERTGALKAAVNEYKFESRREAVRQLAALLDATLPKLPSDTLVTWVPTASSHVRSRGFDHAALLAKTLARRRKYDSRLLITRHTSLSQHELDKKARRKAVQHAFTIDKNVPDRPILLIDDVLTTGLTLERCVHLLKEQGATEVFVAVICCQPLDGSI